MEMLCMPFCVSLLCRSVVVIAAVVLFVVFVLFFHSFSKSLEPSHATFPFKYRLLMRTTATGAATVSTVCYVPTLCNTQTRARTAHTHIHEFLRSAFAFLLNRIIFIINLGSDFFLFFNFIAALFSPSFLAALPSLLLCVCVCTIHRVESKVLYAHFFCLYNISVRSYTNKFGSHSSLLCVPFNAEMVGCALAWWRMKRKNERRKERNSLRNTKLKRWKNQTKNSVTVPETLIFCACCD